MDKLIINPVKHKIPSIEFDPETGIMNMEGLSRAENAPEVYLPAIEWTEKYLQQPQNETVINMRIKYFNTSSAKCLLEIMERFLSLKKLSKKVTINWYHDDDDDDMIDAGKLFQEVLDVKINFIVFEEESL